MKSKKKGIALLMVTSLVLLLLLLGALSGVLSTGHFSTTHSQIEHNYAYYAAQAALQYTLWKCRTGQYNLDLGPFPITEGPATHGLTVNGISDIDIEIVKVPPGQPMADLCRIRVTVRY